MADSLDLPTGIRYFEPSREDAPVVWAQPKDVDARSWAVAFWGGIGLVGKPKAIECNSGCLVEEEVCGGNPNLLLLSCIARVGRIHPVCAVRFVATSLRRKAAFQMVVSRDLVNP